ncbi:MAG: ABC transporter permease [Verrucomicrobia bacterium]|nr:ABC transporter permease [Verrucomicrobiota bacterium]
MSLKRLIGLAAPFLALGLIVLAFSLLHTPEGQPVRDFFLTRDNARFIAAQGIVIALGTLGMALVLLNGGIDLSAGACAALCGVVAAKLLHHGSAGMTVLFAAALTGGAVGLLNGSMIARLRIAPLIVTLGMFGVARGLARWVAADAPIPLPQRLSLNAWVAPLPALSWLLVAPGVWMVLLLAAFLALVLCSTVFGRHLVAVGSNEAAAILCGVRVRLTKMLVYAVAGLFFGLAGAAQAVALQQANPAGSPGLGLDFIAAAVIGGVKLGGGSGGMFGALLGALTMTVLQNGCQQAGWPVPIQEMVIGCAIIVAVGLDQFRHVRP